MMKRILLVVSIWYTMSACFAAGTDVIVQHMQTDVMCFNLDKYNCKVSRTVTILNEKGRKAANFAFSTDRTRKLTACNILITDANGTTLKKVKRNDLQSTQYNPNMVADGATYFFTYLPPTYPINVQIEYEYTYSNGFLSFPTFSPATEYNTEIKHATYTLQVPNDIEVRSKMFNIPDNCITTQVNGNKKQWDIVLDDFPAQQYEPLAPTLTQRLPTAHFAPVKFQFLGTSGNMATWNDFGHWQYALMQGRDELDGNFKNSLRMMTDTCKTQKDKVRTLYNFLRQTTRYNSIQLGIGGWQPATASDVHRLGMGDCKGLTNYMKAMLKAVGIEAQYTVISTTYKHLFADYAGLTQTNHVILQVPLPQDTLWIECTNPTLPLGYLHEDIAGHDAIVITKYGGKLITLPEYGDDENAWSTTSDIYLKENGDARIVWQGYFSGQHYEQWQWTELNDNEKNAEQLRDIFRLPNAKFININAQQDETQQQIPAVHFTFEVECRNIATLTGQRMFVPVSPIYTPSNSLTESERRKNNIIIDENFSSTAITNIHLPQGFIVESMPQSTIESSEITDSNLTISTANSIVTIKEESMTRKGEYDKDLYTTLLTQNSKVTKWKKQKIVIKQQ